ncbi:O-acyltransferase like protein-like [Zerene cesonia]|uniref:O-acyltransferase like protein-like n=1 Tax=Zerene cesonia TaxID=33412 RepID=UPI0018E565E0|nr:O-acyltransferase like protein-like [Zerene cesonia]
MHVYKLTGVQYACICVSVSVSLGMAAHARVAVVAALALLARIAATDTTGPCSLYNSSDNVIHELTDAEYYAMPKLFDLDDYESCLSRREVYCMGSFELSAPPDNQLFQVMTGWSNKWVDNYNHTLLHRGVCVSQRCPHLANKHNAHLDTWFESCVNESTTWDYNITAQLYHLDYCQRGPPREAPLSANQRAFAAVFSAVLAIAAISTTLDLTLTDHTKKDYGWALSWSVRRSWRDLIAPIPSSSSADLRCFNGLRVFCMMSILLEHVAWLSIQTYTSNTRYLEQSRSSPDTLLMTNGTLVVQNFFVMSSFLLAQKLLRQREKVSMVKTFFSTMINRIVRISPSYFLVMWFVTTWWERLGVGPLWATSVVGEAEVCRRKFWTHVLYVNNVVHPEDKCMIQTWYLAADMQLYIAGLLLTLLLRGRRIATLLLAALFLIFTAMNFAMSFTWRLVPNFVLHRPEAIRSGYAGENAFDMIYQSPVGNAPAVLAGLLLAHLHYQLRDSGVRITEYKLFRWISILSAPAALWWAAVEPLLAGGDARGAQANALAAYERPVFLLFVVLALLGAINGVKSPWRSWLSHLGGILPRLSFGALLLHLPLYKIFLATRTAPIQFDRWSTPFEWFGISVVSYIAAIPLALLVELPAQTLYKELTTRRREEHDPTREKLDRNDM